MLGQAPTIAPQGEGAVLTPCQCTKLNYLAAALTHKTCCVLWETLGAEKLEAMSHLQCSREAIHCLPALQDIWLPVLCAFSSGWK